MADDHNRPNRPQGRVPVGYDRVGYESRGGKRTDRKRKNSPGADRLWWVCGQIGVWTIGGRCGRDLHNRFPSGDQGVTLAACRPRDRRISTGRHSCAGGRFLRFGWSWPNQMPRERPVMTLFLALPRRSMAVFPLSDTPISLLKDISDVPTRRLLSSLLPGP